MGAIVRILMLVGGLIAGLFIAEDAFQFPILSMVFGLLVFVVLVAVIAYWSTIASWFVKKDAAPPPPPESPEP